MLESIADRSEMVASLRKILIEMGDNDQHAVNSIAESCVGVTPAIASLMKIYVSWQKWYRENGLRSLLTCGALLDVDLKNALVTCRDRGDLLGCLIVSILLSMPEVSRYAIYNEVWMATKQEFPSRRPEEGTCLTSLTLQDQLKKLESQMTDLSKGLAVCAETIASVADAVSAKCLLPV